MSAMKRVKQLLKHVDKRSMQSTLSTKKSKARSLHLIEPKGIQKPEEVLIKATGKAIDKALNLALFFQGQQDCTVRINTGTVDAIDDLIQNSDLGDVVQQADDARADEAQPNQPVVVAHNHDLPDARIRHASMIQVFVSLQS